MRLVHNAQVLHDRSRRLRLQELQPLIARFRVLRLERDSKIVQRAQDEAELIGRVLQEVLRRFAADDFAELVQRHSHLELLRRALLVDLTHHKQIEHLTALRLDKQTLRRALRFEEAEEQRRFVRKALRHFDCVVTMLQRMRVEEHRHDDAQAQSKQVKKLTAPQARVQISLEGSKAKDSKFQQLHCKL